MTNFCGDTRDHELFKTIHPGARFASSCGAGFGACVIGMATKGGMQASARFADRSDDMTTLFRRVKWMVRRAICGLFGHDTLLHFEQHRLSLRCASCGHETTGWTIAEDGSRARAAASSRRRIETRHAA